MNAQQIPTRASTARLEDALARIARRAAELDRQPRFPTENFADLAAAGALVPPPDGLAGEARLVRAVAAADASTARILDGHLNGIERLTLAAPEPLRSSELARIQEGELLLGVWGADPAAGEGPPARLEHTRGQPVLRGVKTFCSGAGGVQRALILAADHDGSRRLVYLDTTSSQISIDRGWYQASGLRASESHRVEFHDTPILAVLGGPGELSREPYFSRDGIRTSATWAGLADSIMRETLSALDPDRTDAVQAHMLGRMRVAQSTIDRWLEHTTTSLDRPDPRPERDPAVLALECRVALADAARPISNLGGTGLRVTGTDRRQHPRSRPPRPRPVPPAAPAGPQDRKARQAHARRGGIMSATADLARFERLYEESPDPWGYRTSSYEQQKYAATLAALPRRTHGLALEVGCSIGVFTGQLATRCEHLLAIDFSLSALELARRNLQSAGNVDLLRAAFPEETPPGSWDLIVCSEVLYYLQPPALADAIGWIKTQLSFGASVLVVSWRGIGRDEPLTGDEVHDRLARELARWHVLDARRERYRLDRFDGR